MNLTMNRRDFDGLNRLAIQRTLQHGLEASIGAHIHGEGAPTGCFQALILISLAEPQDAKAGAIAEFRMLPALHDLLKNRRG